VVENGYSPAGHPGEHQCRIISRLRCLQCGSHPHYRIFCCWRCYRILSEGRHHIYRIFQCGRWHHYWILSGERCHFYRVLLWGRCHIYRVSQCGKCAHCMIIGRCHHRSICGRMRNHLNLGGVTGRREGGCAAGQNKTCKIQINLSGMDLIQFIYFCIALTGCNCKNAL
jgi:hypothetical protein